MVAIFVAIAVTGASVFAIAIAIAVVGLANGNLRDCAARVIAGVVGDVTACVDNLRADTDTQTDGLADGSGTRLDEGEEEGDCKRDKGFDLHSEAELRCD